MQHAVHLVDLALVEAPSLPDVSDVLDAAVELVVEVVDVFGAFCQPVVDGDGLLADRLVFILCIFIMLPLLRNDCLLLITLLPNGGVEECIGLDTAGLLGRHLVGLINFMDGALLRLRDLGVAFLPGGLLGADIQHLPPLLRLALFVLLVHRNLLLPTAPRVNEVPGDVVELMVELAVAMRHLLRQPHEECVGLGEQIDCLLHILRSRVFLP